MDTISGAHDLSRLLEQAVSVHGDLASRSKEAEDSLTELAALENAVHQLLATAQARRLAAVREFAALLQTTFHDYQAAEHKALESLNKVSSAMHEGRATLAGATDQLHAIHLEVAHWATATRSELSHFEKATATAAATLSHVAEEVGHEYSQVYATVSHEEDRIAEHAEECRSFLSDSAQQITSHFSHLEASIQQSSETLCQFVDHQALEFATQLQQLSENELSTGIAQASDVIKQGLHEKVKTVVEQAVADVSSCVQEGKSKADSHRQTVLDALLPTDGNVKELSDICAPLGDLVDRVGDAVKNIGFLG